MPNTKQPIRVLVVDDCVMTRRLFWEALNLWGYEIVPCRDGEDAWEKLQHEEGPVMMLLDWVMPGISGIELCRRIRQKLQRDYVYIVLATAKQGRENLLEGMRAGADAYLTKPIDLDELRERVEAGRRIVTRIAGLPETKPDSPPAPIFGALLNRDDIVEILRLSLDEQWKQKASVAVMMIGLDDLPPVNEESPGNDTDQLFGIIVTHLREGLGAGYTFGRYGTDKLMLVFPNRDTGQAMTLAENINVWTRNFETERHPQGFRSKIGVTVSSYYDAVSADELIRLAEEGFRRAQTTGEERCFLHWSWSMTFRSEVLDSTSDGE